MLTVSAIMPTRGRPELAQEALASFLAQDYPEKELVIVDDADAPSFVEAPQAPGVRYYRIEQRQAIGWKRNYACSQASGDVIMHFDDDDFSESGRMTDQVDRMLAECAPVTGYHSMVFVEGPIRWKYKGSENYSLGTSLAYRRWYWERCKFPDAGFHANGQPIVGEDNAFVAASARCIVSVDAGDRMWARIHGANTNPREHWRGGNWNRI